MRSLLETEGYFNARITPELLPGASPASADPRKLVAAIERYGVDAYFLDIVGGWTNNPKADMV